MSDPPIIDGRRWWASHSGKGTGGRPRPDTRVRIRDGCRYAGCSGTVAYYEGQWSSRTFPVRLDHTGLTLMYATGDVIELSDL